MRTIFNWSVADHINNMMIPTCVIAADQDYTPLEAKRAYVKKMPQAEIVVVEDSRHATPIDQTEIFNHELMSFLSRQD
jgi:3-oxoadipate enol-lactonase